MEGRAESVLAWSETLARSSTSTAMERRLLEAVMDAGGRPPLEARLWDGRMAWRSDRTPIATLHFGDRPALWRFLLRPESGFAEGYVEGNVRVEGDLPGLLGSEFFRSRLDERMVDTRAHFENEQVGLDEAQLAKLDRICRKVGLRPEQRVIEIGCGRGALALHAAEHYGVYVQAFDACGEQIRWARARARERGLEHRVEFIESDHRRVRGQCDAFLAIGMLEHVGRTGYRELGEVIDRCLAPGGRGLLHFVARAKPERMNAWVTRERGPALGDMLEVLEPFDMAVLDVENLRRHHALTLEHWLRRFDAANQGDDRRIRMHRLHLASAIAAFRVGTRQLYEVVFARADDAGALSWSRQPEP
jgi:cyclopropane-fatty-acyl-phospholipid synthase